MPHRDRHCSQRLAKRRRGIVWLLIAGCTFLAMNTWLILQDLGPMR